jgi:hypothetical protein
MIEIDILDLSNYLQWFGSFLIFFSAALILRIRITKEILIICIYGGNSFLAQCIQTSSIYFVEGQYRNLVGNVYVLAETLILLLLFFYTIKNKFFHYLIALSAIVFTLFWTFTFTNIPTINSSSYRTLRDLLMIAYAVVYFFFLLKNLPEDNLIKLPMFWIASGILFFFSCTFMLSLSMDYIIEMMRDDFTAYWSFRNFLRTFFCAIICIGIWQARNPYSSKT